MFHEGDLQSGIALAIQQNKIVACFVRDDGEESARWENDWLKDDSLLSDVVAHAVILRIESGSQEAGFLSAFCPIDTIPALIFIRNGQLIEHIIGGVEQPEFVRRVKAALGEQDGSSATVGAADQRSEPVAATEGESHTSNQPPESSAGHQESALPAASDAPASDLTPSTDRSPPVASSSAPQPSDSNQQPPSYETSNLQSLFPDRTTRVEADHERQQAAETERLRAASARSRSSQSGAPQSARVDYAAQQRQRLAAAKKEKERVMAAIEADKAARKERERLRKESEQATMSQMPASPDQVDGPQDGARRNPSRRSGLAGTANIQVRLFSGRTLRSPFPATATLAKDVRNWIDEAAAEDAHTSRPPAYTFKQVCNPLPSRSIEVAEEGQSLADLDLLPSATLVLVAVQGGTEAYSGGNGGIQGMVYGAASGALGLVSSTIGTAGSVLGGILGWGGSANDADASSGTESGQAGRQVGAQGGESRGETASKDVADEVEERGKAKDEGRRAGGQPGGIRVRTFADQREDEKGKQGETWYNGNQLSFQPKDDPDEDKP
ncbi:hypothetical protein NA57DRAFT_50798 [Rhizodiscina lignyota]|uniref:UBX domain-containing protein 2 n=1 Tax=Rhizodiscina lignyota TaxID=1504668 RepID=A0A9P4IQ06_9PEZI|nr:hypothetical protein NA57DRAFT_50798 [Rhizodiscina lignyota]